MIPETAGTKAIGAIVPPAPVLPAAPRTEDPIMVVTRMRLRHLWALVPALLRFHRLSREARSAPGFIRGQVCVADPWTIINISIWRSRWAMLRWSGRAAHVDAVRWTYGRVGEIWSADWHLNAVSASAHAWYGALPVDLYSCPE